MTDTLVSSLRSNSQPFGREEVVLRELLANYTQQLASIEASIVTNQTQIMSYRDTIGRLEKLLNEARDAVAIYEKHQVHLDTIRAELITRFRPSGSSPKTTSGPPSLIDDVTARVASWKNEKGKIKTVCKGLRATIVALNVGLRCQRHRLNFTEMALQTSILTRDSIAQILQAVKDNFRPIKRVPDEIWLEIIGIAIDHDNEALALNTDDYVTSSAALPFAQVCLTWRRVMLHSPSIWTTIHCSASGSNSLDKRKKLIELLIRRAKGKPVNLIEKRCYQSQTELGCAWWPEGYNWDRSTLLRGHTYRSILSYGQSRPESALTLISPKSNVVTLEAAVPGEAVPILDSLLRRLKELRSINLVNIMLRPREPLVSETLKHLYIVFNTPIPQLALDGQPYDLARLLGDSLRSLSLSHYHPSMLSWQRGTSIDLPDLHNLSITPHEHRIMSMLGVTSLDTLSISLPYGPLVVTTDVWVKELATLCKNVSSLTLDWVKPGLFRLNQSSPVDLISIFILLQPGAPKLKSLKLMGGMVDGAKLCDHLETAAKEASWNLVNLTIESCVGVSRTDCARLGDVVGKLNVFNTYHAIA